MCVARVPCLFVRCLVLLFFLRGCTWLVVGRRVIACCLLMAVGSCCFCVYHLLCGVRCLRIVACSVLFVVLLLVDGCCLSVVICCLLFVVDSSVVCRSLLSMCLLVVCCLLIVVRWSFVVC